MKKIAISFILIILLTILLLNQFKAVSPLDTSYNIFDKQVASNSEKKIHFIQQFNLENEDAQKFQFIEHLNVCIIITQRRLLVWNTVLNQLITDFQYQSDSINIVNTLDYNILTDDADINLTKNMVLIAHSKPMKQVYIFSYLLQVQQQEENKIQAIEDLSLAKSIQVNNLRQKMLVQTDDFQLASLQFDGNKISVDLMNSFGIDQRSNLQTKQIDNIYRLSQNQYLIEKEINFYFSSISNTFDQIDLHSLSLNSKLISIGSLKNKTYKYLIYQENNKLNLAFLNLNEGKIFFSFQYSDFSLISSNTEQNAIYLLQNITKNIYRIQFNCKQQICYEERKNYVNLPSHTVYLFRIGHLDSHINIIKNQKKLMAQYLECKISNKFFDLESFECLNTIIHQKQQNFLSERVRILDSISDTINQGTQVNDDSTDDSESSAVQIVEIVIGVVAAIVFLVIVVICIRKYRQKKFKQFQLKQQQQIEANKIQTAQKVVQTQQYLQLPGGPNNPELSGVSDQRQFQSVGSGIPLQNINNGQLQQNPPFPQQINKNQIQSNPQFIQPIPVHQQLSAPPALNHIVNPALANPHIQNPPYQIQLIPGMNGVQDPYIAEQQKQLLLKEMQLKQMELQMREQNLIQIHQQQQQQLQLQPQYGDYGIQNRFASNNAISNQDQFNKPSNDYKKLSAQIEEKQQVKPQMNKNLNLNQQNSKNQQQNSDQNETPTNNPENLQFNQMKYDADNPPLPAPPANNNDNDKKVFENGGQFNYSIPKKGYFFGNQNVPQNENQIPNGFNNLNSTEVQKNIFEQQMMAIMASGAIPAGVEKKPFIQPPIAEDGEQHPNGAIDHSAFKQYNFQNQSQSLQQSKPNNQKLSDTQVQKQNFQDEILRQLQGTEVFQKNKQNQIALEPIQEQQFPKFIHDQEEEEDANLHKFDDDQDDEDDDYNNYNPNQNKNLVSQVDQINKIAVMSMNLNHNNNANINNNNNQKIENGQPFNYNGSQGIQKSLQNNFIDYMKDQLGESLGNNKLIPKFIESHVEQSLQQIKQDNIQNQEKKEIIDFNQIKLEQSQNQNQKENIQNEQKVQKANYNQILQNQTDNGQKNNSNKQKPSQLQDENSKLTCVICLDNRPEVVFQCGHTMCEPCSITIQKKSNICPLCNIPIQTTIKLFFA